MKIKYRVDGLKELDKALGELPKSTGRNVLKRTLIKAGAPMAEAASLHAPRRTGALQHEIVISTKVKNNAGKAEYSAAMAAGLGKGAARAALISARRSASESASFAEVYIGPTTKAFYGMFQEFGTSHNAAKPFLRPAFDENVQRVLDAIRDTLAAEIEKTRARLARKAARAAAKAQSKP